MSTAFVSCAPFDVGDLSLSTGIAISDFPRASALGDAGADPPSCGNGCCLLRSLSISGTQVTGTSAHTAYCVSLTILLQTWGWTR